MKTYVFDCEANGLTPDKFYVLSYATRLKTTSLTTHEEMRDFLLNADMLIGHNIIGWDIPNLERVLGIKVKAKLVDTMSLSWALFPDRGKHGLEFWGEDFGIKKPEIEDWHGLTIEEYTHRCEQDVKINKKVWESIWEMLTSLYGNSDKLWKFVDYIMFKSKCLSIQERNKWKLDIEYIKNSIAELEKERQPKLDALSDAMPPVPVIKKKGPPKRLHKKDGTPTAIASEWYSLLDKEGLSHDHIEPVEYIDGYSPPKPNAPQQVKDWLFGLGWKPTTFKTVKGVDGNREVPQINLERGQGVCPSVLALLDEEPAIAYLRDLSVLNHRIPFLNGLLESADEEGYVKARASGLTNTLRLRHAELVNLPKADKPYAASIRGSLIADGGTLLFGSDQASLEDRIKQHFMYKYDPELVEEMNTEGFDPHLKLAVAAGAVTEKQVEDYKSGKDKSIKPIRDMYKNGNYACQYGAHPPRLAKTCNVPIDKAAEVFDAYWEVNKSIKLVTEELKESSVKEVNGKMWLKNPINEFWYSLRSYKDIFSTLVQGTASYVFDMWLYFLGDRLNDLIAQFHDEMIIRSRVRGEEDKYNITHDIIAACQKVNDCLQLNRELSVEVQYGTRYSEIH